MSDKSVIKIQQENLELSKENKALKETLTKLLIELDTSRGIERKSEAERIKLTPEQRIIEDQITYFEAISITRCLSLDETRTLDLLIKNKRLLDKEKPIEPDYTKVPDDDSDLLRIAGNVEPEPTENQTNARTKTSKKNSLA